MPTRLGFFMATTLRFHAATCTIERTKAFTWFILLCVSVLGTLATDSSEHSSHHHHHPLSDHNHRDYHPSDRHHSDPSSMNYNYYTSQGSRQRIVFDLLHHYIVHAPVEVDLSNPEMPPSRLAMRPVPGRSRHSSAYAFLDDRPSVEVSASTVQYVSELLADEDEFTILAAFRLETARSCSLISITSHNDRLMNIELSGQRKDIRLNYLHRNKSRTEMFPVNELSIGEWHLLAITLSRTFVQVFVDCDMKYERHIASLDVFSTLHAERDSESGRPMRPLRLWLGQQDASGGFFKGAIEYVKVAIFPQGYLDQCPLANTACPTCSQFRDLEKYVRNVYLELEHLREKIHSAEARIAELEKCDCLRSCEVEGSEYRDGATWMPDSCTHCECRSGEVICLPQQCPPLTCSHPVLQEGQCCPTCLRSCVYGGLTYEHGESFHTVCTQCTCNNKDWVCSTTMRENCPALTCPQHEQISIPGQCCNFCRDAVSFCAQGNNCHPNATCIDLDTKYTCRCDEGFEGDGERCTDRDECKTEGGPHGHHCQSNSVCINLPGAYRCQCNQGFTSIDQYTCEELDECAAGLHDCTETSQCVNTMGSYTCQCRQGYRGQGNDCQPVCEAGCDNGGSCVAPEFCLCRDGYTGNSCQFDIDECAVGPERCHPHSVCINIHGSYFCQCRNGYRSFLPDNQHGTLCIDEDECSSSFTNLQSVCPLGSICHNTPGSYQCICTNPEICNTNCTHRRNMYRSGQVWNDTRNRCMECECTLGEAECKAKTCDCHSPHVDLGCCPHCIQPKCSHNGLEYHEREIWMSGCQICQCMDGEVDCSAMECPRLLCSPTIQLEGDCCPRCAHADPCLDAVSTSSVIDRETKDALDLLCYYEGEQYQGGQAWSLQADHCTSCLCQGGHVCCSYNRSSCGSPTLPPYLHNPMEALLPDNHRFFQQYIPPVPEKPRRRPRKNRKKPGRQKGLVYDGR